MRFELAEQSLLLYLNDYSFREIARFSSLSHTTVSRQIKKKLKEYGFDLELSTFVGQRRGCKNELEIPEVFWREEKYTLKQLNDQVFKTQMDDYRKIGLRGILSKEVPSSTKTLWQALCHLNDTLRLAECQPKTKTTLFRRLARYLKWAQPDLRQKEIVGILNTPSSTISRWLKEDISNEERQYYLKMLEVDAFKSFSENPKSSSLNAFFMQGKLRTVLLNPLFLEPRLYSEFELLIIGIKKGFTHHSCKATEKVIV